MVLLSRASYISNLDNVFLILTLRISEWNIKVISFIELSHFQLVIFGGNLVSPDAAKTPTVGGKVLLQTRISFIPSLAIGVTTRAVLPYICGTDAECWRWWGGGRDMFGDWQDRRYGIWVRLGWAPHYVNWYVDKYSQGVKIIFVWCATIVSINFRQHVHFRYTYKPLQCIWA